MQKHLLEIVASATATQECTEQSGRGEPEAFHKLFPKLVEDAGLYPVPNLAVEVCCGTLLKITERYRGENRSDAFLSQVGRLAYCTILPRLSDRDGIRDFIACVVHGMAIGVIPSTEGTRLLYGAQVAQAALPAQKRYKKRAKSGRNSTGNQPLTQNPSMT